jgi:hypothetical protein
MLGGGRHVHTATVLQDGRVALIGGIGTSASAGGSPGSTSVETYSPAAGFVAGSPLHQPRAFHTTTLLPDGSVLVAGGADGEHVLSSAEVGWP